KFNIVNGDILINFIGRSITDDFRFRVEFLNNNAPTGFFFDFDVAMQKNFKQVTHIEKFSKFYIQIKIFFDIMNKYLIL
ncbi:hypothetical protein J8G47_001391, partial [Campylobacter jejuni]|nr:hypothetical protein [Campylobacter jejuni]